MESADLKRYRINESMTPVGKPDIQLVGRLRYRGCVAS